MAAFILFLSAHPFLVKAQEYSYTQYNIKDGLAGSTVYCSAQDSDGFMWFGTETGLSRFDGTHFKNFSTDDGLTDNEILKIFCDSKGRIWFSVFKKSVCYYYKGKIYNQFNDSTLSHLRLTGIAWNICEDAHGNILILEFKKLHKISPSGQIKVFTDINGKPFKDFLDISESLNGNFWVLESHELFELKEDNIFYPVRSISFDITNIHEVKLSRKTMVWRYNESSFKSAMLPDGEATIYDYNYAHISFTIVKDSLICENNSGGSTIHNMAKKRVAIQILNGKPVSSFFMDDENNIWCTTLGEGIFRLGSLDFKSLSFTGTDDKKLGIYAMARHENRIIAGGFKEYIFSWDTLHPEKISKALMPGININSSNHIKAIQILHNRHLFIASDVSMYEVSAKLEVIKTKNNINVKGICKINDDSILIANAYRMFLFNARDFRITDTLWNERTTSVYYLNDSFYAGTLDGLLILARNRLPYFPGNKYPVLKNNITAISSSDKGIIWLATYGGGVVAYYKGKVVANLSENDGLTSNICRCLYIDKGQIWVGTDKGLNKITLENEHYTITKFTIADGLASNMINSVFVDNGTVYAGTPEGITYFNEKSIALYSRCDLHIDQIIAGKDTFNQGVDNIKLAHSNNNIYFEFAGISFKSAGNIKYYYNLSGVDSLWQTTTANSVNYTTLPSGHYTFQLKAVNKFGVLSNLCSIHFEVDQLLWEKTWFRFLSTAILLLLMWTLVQWRVSVTKKRAHEKFSVMQRMAGLEQMALKSQMNPHFIFNSLNSIQQFVMDKDVQGANKFITDFSSLIRKTLEFSAKEKISLADEMKYLITYSQLEQERMAGSFSFSIDVENTINTNETFIPPMILQPYIENSIRHGIRYRGIGKGEIHINIKSVDDRLQIIIEDNGIGREAASKYKSVNNIQYQSKGMSLTAERIEIFNKQNKEKIIIRVEDMVENGIPCGTRIILSFPCSKE